MMNKLGWIIGGTIVALVAGVIVYKILPKGALEPTIPSDALAAIELPAPPAILTLKATPGDAGPVVAKALAGVRDKPEFKAKDLGDADVQALIDAGRLQDLVLFGGPLKLEDVLTIKRETAVTKPLRELTLAVRNKAINLDNAKQREQSNEALKSLAALGRKIALSGPRIDLLQLGLYIEMDAVNTMAFPYKQETADPASAALFTELDRYLKALQAVNTRIANKTNEYVWKFPPGEQAANLIEIAKNDQTKAFRVDAILLLGVCYQVAQDEAKKAAIARTLDKLAQDRDPDIQAAAARAKAVTAAETNTVFAAD